jgi:glycosyltransferase involved in cell wall biosynthesis
MKLLYVFSRYSSHFRTGQAYFGLIREWHSFVSKADEADVVILHGEPHDYAAMYGALGLYGKYVVSCTLWEADDLPDSYKRSLDLVQEVWVPSQYCRAVFARYHPRVHVVPYVVDRELKCSDLDRAAVRQMVNFNPAHIYYLTITKVWDKRKNVQFLIDAFERLGGDMPNARLIVKAGVGERHPRISDERITMVNANLTERQIAALYECADIYVSAHHSEGWGLTMADALFFGKPTIATGYSGNLEFMNASNSFLLAFEEEYIREEDVFGSFISRMRWAYPSEKDLEEKLLLLYRLRDDHAVQEEVKSKLNAAANIACFCPTEVGKILRKRLEEIEHHRELS